MCAALSGCTPATTPGPTSQPAAPASQPSTPAAAEGSCADDVEQLRETLAEIVDATSPRIAPGPAAPWPAKLDPSLDFAFFLHHEDGRWQREPFDLASPDDIERAYLEAQQRHPGSQGFLVAADPSTPTRDIAKRLVALEAAGISIGSFNVEAPLAQPIDPPDPAWLEAVGPRLDAAGELSDALIDISSKQLNLWEPLCGNLGWTFEISGLAPEDRVAGLAKRFGDAHAKCDCLTSADRWATLLYLLALGTQPVTTTDADYRVRLAPNGTLVHFAPDERWGETIARLPAPTGEPVSLWLAEAGPTEG